MDAWKEQWHLDCATRIERVEDGFRVTFFNTTALGCVKDLNPGERESEEPPDVLYNVPPLRTSVMFQEQGEWCRFMRMGDVEDKQEMPMDPEARRQLAPVFGCLGTGTLFATPKAGGFLNVDLEQLFWNKSGVDTLEDLAQTVHDTVILKEDEFFVEEKAALEGVSEKSYEDKRAAHRKAFMEKMGIGREHNAEDIDEDDAFTQEICEKSGVDPCKLCVRLLPKWMWSVHFGCIYTDAIVAAVAREFPLVPDGIHLSDYSPFLVSHLVYFVEDERAEEFLSLVRGAATHQIDVLMEDPFFASHVVEDTSRCPPFCMLASRLKLYDTCIDSMANFAGRRSMSNIWCCEWTMDRALAHDLTSALVKQTLPCTLQMKAGVRAESVTEKTHGLCAQTFEETRREELAELFDGPLPNVFCYF